MALISRLTPAYAAAAETFGNGGQACTRCWQSRKSSHSSVTNWVEYWGYDWWIWIWRLSPAHCCARVSCIQLPSIDYMMHCIAQGVFAKVFKLIIKTLRAPFSAGAAGEFELLVAKATSNIKGHNGIEHGPRCTVEYSHYKSSEWRDWGLLFFPKRFEVLADQKRIAKDFFENFVDLAVGIYYFSLTI